MAHSQYELLKQRRFLPFFLTQALGAFNDNVFRNALLALRVYQMGLSTEQSTLYANLAPALFILPYFLFSATAGQIAEKLEKARLIRITTAMEIAKCFSPAMNARVPSMGSRMNTRSHVSRAASSGVSSDSQP